MAEKKPVISLLKSNSDELVVLRARVQQQSELIAMLKRRADETLMQVRMIFLLHLKSFLHVCMQLLMENQPSAVHVHHRVFSCGYTWLY